jgi:hypothetical protein
MKKSTLKFIWKHQRPQIAKAMLRKKEQCWWYHDTQLQTILQSNSNKNTWYWHKNRHEDQWNRIEDPDMNPQNYTHLIFDKCAKNIGWRKIASSTNVVGKSGYPSSRN